MLYEGNYVKTYQQGPTGGGNYDGAIYAKDYIGGPFVQYSNAAEGELDYGTDPAYFRGDQYLGGVAYEKEYTGTYQGYEGYTKSSGVDYERQVSENYTKTYQGDAPYDQDYIRTYSRGYVTDYIGTYEITTDNAGYTENVPYEGVQIYSSAPEGELDYGTDPAYFRGDQYEGVRNYESGLTYTKGDYIKNYDQTGTSPYDTDYLQDYIKRIRATLLTQVIIPRLTKVSTIPRRTHSHMTVRYIQRQRLILSKG